jgi:hypothetical protein
MASTKGLLKSQQTFSVETFKVTLKFAWKCKRPRVARKHLHSLISKLTQGLLWRACGSMEQIWEQRME